MPDALRLWSDPVLEEAKLQPYLLDDGKEHPLVLVFPGGGYNHLAPHEGEPVARAMNQRGFHAAVVSYRIAPRFRHPAMLHDAQRAVRLARQHAVEWRVAGANSETGGKVAVLGFSAGGHLAASVATLYHHFVNPDDDLAATISARPDAAVLCYPVIDFMGPAAHTGSRKGLLGEDAEEDLVRRMSLHPDVTENTPPIFLWHTMDDGGVPPENSLVYFMACRKQGVPVEMHLYEHGRHGLGLAPEDESIRTWVDLAGLFLKRHLVK